MGRTGSRGVRCGIRPVLRISKWLSKVGCGGTHVVAEGVEPSVITRRLLGQLSNALEPVLDSGITVHSGDNSDILIPRHQIVFGDKVSGAGVKASGEERAEEEVEERVPTKGVDDGGVHGEDEDEVEQVVECRSLRADETRSEGVE